MTVFDIAWVAWWFIVLAAVAASLLNKNNKLQGELDDARKVLSMIDGGAYKERTLEEVVSAWREQAFGSRGTQTHVKLDGDLAAAMAMQPHSFPELSEEERKKLEETDVCQHCGGRHVFTCPYIVEATYHADGKLASVRYDPARAQALEKEILYI